MLTKEPRYQSREGRQNTIGLKKTFANEVTAISIAGGKVLTDISLAIIDALHFKELLLREYQNIMKKVLITGAGRGIGLELTKQFLSQDGFYVIALSRNISALQKIESSQLQAISFDLTSADFSELEQALDKIDSIDIIINNAGLLINKSFTELNQTDWQRSMDVNVFGPVKLIQSCLPKLEKAVNAHVLNISSMGGFQGASKFPGLSAYSSSKAALACLTECLAEEFKNEGIIFNCLSLGAVNTDMLQQAFPGYKAPLESHEIADFIFYFSTQGHRFMNGKNIPVSLHNPTSNE